jgi:hypothetical protein
MRNPHVHPASSGANRHMGFEIENPFDPVSKSKSGGIREKGRQTVTKKKGGKKWPNRARGY